MRRICGLGHRVYGQYGGRWLRGKPRMQGEGTDGVSSYMTHVTEAASLDAFKRRDEAELLLSAESLPENSSFINFATFAKNYPEKFFQLLSELRPEFQELCIEYYVLHKSQSFIGKAHGFIQTRTWQALRIIEQTIGALIILGIRPDESVIRPILEKANLDTTPCGSLASMIVLYASSQSYAVVAKAVHAPVPAIRKIFRPIITQMLTDKDIKVVAVGAYLRNLAHQASLTKAGLSKRCIARTRRVKNMQFTAPPADNNPLMSFGTVSVLRDTPWNMLEISSTHRMAQITPSLKKQGKRLFGKKAAQIFAPVNAEGELVFGYIFARSESLALTRALMRIRGISELSAVYKDDGALSHAVTIPHADVLAMMEKHGPATSEKVRVGDFVEILTGPASGYHGVTIQANAAVVRVDFPTGRKFLVNACSNSVAVVQAPRDKQTFWGCKL